MWKNKQETAEKTTQAKGKFLPKRKKRKKWIIAAAVVVVLAVVLVLRGRSKLKDLPLLDLTDTTVLSRMDLENSVSATGTVESAARTTVYSTMAYPVMAVHAEVGDRVEAGQVLAELDGETLRDQIASQEITLGVSSQSGAQQVKAAQDNYNNFKTGLEQGLNSSLNNTENQADNAYQNYLKAKLTYERTLDSLNLGENTTLISAESALRNAENALETARDAYETARDSYQDAQNALEEADDARLEGEAALSALEESQTILEQELEELLARQAAGEPGLEPLIAEKEAAVQALDAPIEEASAALEGLNTAYETALALRDQTGDAKDGAARSLEHADAAYDDQKSLYNATVTSVDNALADALTNMDNAWKTYQDALVSVKSVEKSVQEQLQTYENTLTSAQIGANKAAAEEGLRQLRVDLEGTQITAPCAGTVTAVYAEVGRSGSGLLFVIEDVDNLVVETSVKGYDVGTVREGMEVVIRSDATGDARMAGEITSIAPTSGKNAMGVTDPTGEAVFAAEVAVNEQNTGLRIGMEAQLDYIIEREADVLAVPYDAVYRNETGETCILIAEEQSDGRYFITELPVTTGMDDDLDMAVTGDGVTEGLRVIHEPDAYRYLLGQTVTAGTGLHTMPFGPMGMMGRGA